MYQNNNSSSSSSSSKPIIKIETSDQLQSNATKISPPLDNSSATEPASSCANLEVRSGGNDQQQKMDAVVPPPASISQHNAKKVRFVKESPKIMSPTSTATHTGHNAKKLSVTVLMPRPRPSLGTAAAMPHHQQQQKMPQQERAVPAGGDWEGTGAQQATTAFCFVPLKRNSGGGTSQSKSNAISDQHNNTSSGSKDGQQRPPSAPPKQQLLLAPAPPLLGQSAGGTSHGTTTAVTTTAPASTAPATTTTTVTVGAVTATSTTTAPTLAAMLTACRGVRRNLKQLQQVRTPPQQRQRNVWPKFSPKSHAPQYVIRAQSSTIKFKHHQQYSSPSSASSSSLLYKQQQPLLEQQQQNEVTSAAHSSGSNQLDDYHKMTTVPAPTVTLATAKDDDFNRRGITTVSTTVLSPLNLAEEKDDSNRMTTVSLPKLSAAGAPSPVAPYTVMCTPQPHHRHRQSAPFSSCTVSSSAVTTTTATVLRRPSLFSSASVPYVLEAAPLPTALSAAIPIAEDDNGTTIAAAAVDGTGPRRSQRKSTNGVVVSAAVTGLSTTPGTSKGTAGGELKRNNSAGSDGLLGAAALRPKRMSILNKQLNYAEGEDESEGGGGVVPLPTARPSQIGVGLQFQAELPENDDEELQKERPKASDEEDPYFSQADPDECLWNGSKFASPTFISSKTSSWFSNQQLLLNLKELESFCSVARRHSNLDIERALHLFNTSNFCLQNALRDLEQFAANCTNATVNTKWTPDMDEQFIELLNKHQKNFGKIAKNLPYGLTVAQLVQRYYTLKMERCFTSNEAQFVRCPNLKILGSPTDPQELSPVPRTQCANCTLMLWRDPSTAVAEWRGRRRPPVMCQPCELYARKQKKHRPVQLLLKNDPNYANELSKQRNEHDIAAVSNANAGTTAAVGADTTVAKTADVVPRRHYPCHDDRNCMLACEAATRARVQQQQRASWHFNIKEEVPMTPEDKAGATAAIEQSDDEAANGTNVAEGEARNENGAGVGIGGGGEQYNNGDKCLQQEEEEREMKQRWAQAFVAEGKNFEAIAACLGGKWSADDVANFYSMNQLELRLDYLISLYERAKADERNVPTLRANTARNNGQQQKKVPAANGGKKNNNGVPPVVKQRIVVIRQAEQRGENVAKREDGGVTRRRKRGNTTAVVGEQEQPPDNSTDDEKSVEREEQHVVEKKQRKAAAAAESVESIETEEKKQKTGKD
ncbi:hypothetical protein niasHT_030537 [Heterodera trifolii]|uniref:ELM2 domain-containing protein n=1 Tax=Heterodera trifolii TaxID=157864 RepID=A0ABD2J224_9BILA